MFLLYKIWHAVVFKLQSIMFKSNSTSKMGPLGLKAQGEQDQFRYINHYYLTTSNYILLFLVYFSVVHVTI